MNLVMKLISGLATLFLSFTLIISTAAAQENNTSPTSEKVDVYGLFWPIVPGKTVGDPMFMLKQLKESLSGMFVFGNVGKSEHQIQISEKRLVEAAKLIENKDFSNAVKSIEMNAEARKSALLLKKKAIEEKADALELTNKLVKSLGNQEKALIYLQSQMGENEKAKMNEILKQIPLQISEAK